jgi:hypothetical protein
VSKIHPPHSASTTSRVNEQKHSLWLQNNAPAASLDAGWVRAFACQEKRREDWQTRIASELEAIVFQNAISRIRSIAFRLHRQLTLTIGDTAFRILTPTARLKANGTKAVCVLG